MDINWNILHRTIRLFIFPLHQASISSSFAPLWWPSALVTGMTWKKNTGWSNGENTRRNMGERGCTQKKRRWSPRTRMLTRMLRNKGNTHWHSCGTPWHDTLIWHSGKTLSLYSIAQHCCEPLLLCTLVGHSETSFLDALAGTLLLDTLTWHSCGALLLDTFVGHSYLTRILDTLTWHFCKTPWLDTLLGHVKVDLPT